MANTQLLDIILIATVAGFILFRLYSVLGRRTGHERPPQDYRLSSNTAGDPPVPVNDKVKSLAPVLAERSSDPVAAGLLDIALADRGFDKDRFITGARSAYEIIVTAFAGGDRGALKPLLSQEVYAVFDAVIHEREKLGQKTAFTFVGFKDVKIIAALLKGRMGEVTLSFEAQFISATVDAQGKTVDGDTTLVRDVTDVWTFARDLSARDPNWALVATSGEAS